MAVARFLESFRPLQRPMEWLNKGWRHIEPREVNMAMGEVRSSWWEITLEIAKFVARLPLAIVAIAAGGCVSWLIFWFIFRCTQYVYFRFLNHPWSIP